RRRTWRPRRTRCPRRTPVTTTRSSWWTGRRTTSCCGTRRRRSPTWWTELWPAVLPIVGGGGYVFRHGDAHRRTHRLGLERHAVPRRGRRHRRDERGLRRAGPGAAHAGAVPGAVLRTGAEVLRAADG